MEINVWVDIGDTLTRWRSAEAAFPGNTRLFVSHLLEVHQKYCPDCSPPRPLSRNAALQSTSIEDNMGDVLCQTTHEEHTPHMDGCEGYGTGDHTYNSQPDLQHKSQVEDTSDTPDWDTISTETKVNDGISFSDGEHEKLKPYQAQNDHTCLESRIESQERHECLDEAVIVANSDNMAPPDMHLPVVDRTDISQLLGSCDTPKDIHSEVPECNTELMSHVKDAQAITNAIVLAVEPYSSQCNTILQQSASLLHEKTHSKVDEYSCDVCGKLAANRTKLEYHMRHHRGDRRYACRVCPKTFYYKSHLDTHMKGHEGRKDFRCELCDKTFVINGHLKSHMLSHTGARRQAEKRHTCHYCGRGFREPHALRNHYNTHAEVPKTCTCPQCGKTFSNMTLVKKHRSKTHDKALYSHSKIPTVCHLCGSQFTRKDNLSRHMKTFHK